MYNTPALLSLLLWFISVVIAIIILLGYYKPDFRWPIFSKQTVLQRLFLLCMVTIVAVALATLSFCFAKRVWTGISWGCYFEWFLFGLFFFNMGLWLIAALLAMVLVIKQKGILFDSRLTAFKFIFSSLLLCTTVSCVFYFSISTFAGHFTGSCF